MMNRKETIESLKKALVDRAKKGRTMNLGSCLAYSTGYMPELTLEEFDGIIEYLSEKLNIIF